MRDSEKRLFQLFLEYSWSEIRNQNSDWLFTGDRIFQDGVDTTDDYFKWFEIKMKRGDTSWLKN